MSKYNRIIIGFNGIKTETDVYRVIKAFDVTCPALQHLIKKALCTGLRGHKDKRQDLLDIIESAQAALKIHDDEVKNG